MKSPRISPGLVSVSASSSALKRGKLRSASSPPPDVNHASRHLAAVISAAPNGGEKRVAVVRRAHHRFVTMRTACRLARKPFPDHANKRRRRNCPPVRDTAPGGTRRCEAGMLVWRPCSGGSVCVPKTPAYGVLGSGAPADSQRLSLLPGHRSGAVVHRMHTAGAISPSGAAPYCSQPAVFKSTSRVAQRMQAQAQRCTSSKPMRIKPKP